MIVYNKLIKVIVFGLVCASVACSDANTARPWENKLGEMAELACQAQVLRKARYDLADSIRYYQDSVMHGSEYSDQKVAMWEQKLEEMDIRKKKVTIKSRDLADTIHQRIILVTQDLNPDEKRVFNDSLTFRTNKMGCE